MSDEDPKDRLIAELKTCLSIAMAQIEIMAPYYLADPLITQRNVEDLESIAQWGSVHIGEPIYLPPHPYRAAKPAV